MKNHYIFAIAFLLVLILPMMSATIATVTPTASQNISSNFVTNWTFANETDGITNPTSAASKFYWNATGSWVEVTKSSFSCTATNCIATLAVSSMGEGLGVLNFTAGNATDVLGGTLSSQFRIDKTNPTVTLSATPSSSRTIQTNAVTLTWAATDTSSISSTAVAVTAQGDGACTIPAISYTAASGTETLSGTQTQCAGLYTATITTTDTSGLSSSDSTTFKIYYPEGGTAIISGTPVVVQETELNFFDKIINWFKSLFGL